MDDCAACEKMAHPESRWKGVALFVGAIVFCPCHLPATLAALSLLAGTAWITGNKPLVYATFALIYVFVVFFGLRYLMRARDRELAREAVHQEHAPPAGAVP